LYEVSSVAKASTTGDALCTLGVPLVDVAYNFVELGLVDLWPLFCSGRERVADAAGFGEFLDLFNELGMNTLVDKDSATGTAALALVEEKPDVSTLSGTIEVSVGHDYVGTFATEFESQSFESLGGIAHDDLSGAVFAGERDFINAWVSD
jgi:hypothetical protein